MLSKKLISLLLIIFFFTTILLAIDWYYWVNRHVIIKTKSNITYIGKVNHVIEFEICRRKDMFGTCIWKDVYYTMFLNENNVMRVIACESIVSIKELPRKN
jgi:small nuclear ribonucleoprotein (snRNP)-like protein